MRKSTKVTWESFTQDGERYVREVAGEHITVLGPLHEFESFTRFIEHRRFIIESAIWLVIRSAQKQDQVEKWRDECLKAYLESDKK